jgi:hypothetical protein
MSYRTRTFLKVLDCLWPRLEPENDGNIHPLTITYVDSACGLLDLSQRLDGQLVHEHVAQFLVDHRSRPPDDVNDNVIAEYVAVP